MNTVKIYSREINEDEKGEPSMPMTRTHCMLHISHESMEFDHRDLFALGVIEMMRLLLAANADEVEWYIAPIGTKRWVRMEGDAMRGTVENVAREFVPGKRLKGFIDPDKGIRAGEVFADFVAGGAA